MFNTLKIMLLSLLLAALFIADIFITFLYLHVIFCPLYYVSLIPVESKQHNMSASHHTDVTN